MFLNYFCRKSTYMIRIALSGTKLREKKYLTQAISLYRYSRDFLNVKRSRIVRKKVPGRKDDVV